MLETEMEMGERTHPGEAIRFREAEDTLLQAKPYRPVICKKLCCFVAAEEKAFCYVKG